jgi:hypothetical protein
LTKLQYLWDNGLCDADCECRTGLHKQPHAGLILTGSCWAGLVFAGTYAVRSGFKDAKFWLASFGILWHP